MKKLGKMYKVTEFSINNQMRFSVFYFKKNLSKRSDE